jgi:hypothetical protein
MLRAGCVTTYEQVGTVILTFHISHTSPQAGAEYGKEGKKEYLRVEAEAKYGTPYTSTLSLMRQ